MKYGATDTKQFMAFATPLLKLITCILTNIHCSTSLDKFTFDNIVRMQFDSVKILHYTANVFALQFWKGLSTEKPFLKQKTQPFVNRSSFSSREAPKNFPLLKQAETIYKII